MEGDNVDEVQQLPENWQPSDELTAWQWDDCMIWDMKTRIKDLEPSNVDIMWRKLQEYRHWIEREEKRADDAAKALTAAEARRDAALVALQAIAEMTGEDEYGVYDEWSQTVAFQTCQRHAADALAADASAQS